MSTAVILKPDEWQQFKADVTQTLREELVKVRSEVKDGPMTKEETCKYLHCSISTLQRKWIHLRHVVNGTAYWYKNEIDNYIKKH